MPSCDQTRVDRLCAELARMVSLAVHRVPHELLFPASCLDSTALACPRAHERYDTEDGPWTRGGVCSAARTGMWWCFSIGKTWRTHPTVAEAGV
jgi:hypothetical protein